MAFMTRNRHHKYQLALLFTLVVVTLSLLKTAEASQSELSSGQQQPSANASPPQIGGATQQVSGLQAHLNAIQAQAQRQFAGLNGLMLNAANMSHGQQGAQQLVAGNRYPNVLEAFANVGKAIQQQMNGGSVHIVSSPQQAESATSRKNEYQAIGGGGPQQEQQLHQQPGGVGNYREQGEQLRQEIARRVGQLQQVVGNSMDLVKSNGDLIVRRLLEQLSSRLDQAKSRADKIVSTDPTTNEMAVKALAAINLGLNNLNTIITNIVSRMDLAAKADSSATAAAVAGATQVVGHPAGAVNQQAPTSGGIGLVSPVGAAGGSGLLDPGKFKINLQQLGQQFQSALNGSTLHQQLMRQRGQLQATLLGQAAQQK